MKKDYYLSYSIKDLSQNEILAYLLRKYDFSFTNRDSSYLGVYYLYEGIYADKMTIKVDRDSENSINIIGKNQLRLDIILDKGKNKDKESKYNYLKKLFDKDDEFVFISEEVLEN